MSDKLKVIKQEKRTSIPNHKTAKEQEPLIGPIDRNRFKRFGEFTYQNSYADIAFELLSESDTAKTMAHVCHALSCSKPTLHRWIKTFPEFAEAIESGLQIGKMRWRDRLAEHAFEPSQQVNNGLIKLLSSNVYGIKEDADPIAVININTADPEKMMKDRGIPIPAIDSEDLEDDE